MVLSFAFLKLRKKKLRDLLEFETVVEKKTALFTFNETGYLKSNQTEREWGISCNRVGMWLGSVVGCELRIRKLR